MTAAKLLNAHLYVPSREVPGTCATCRLADPKRLNAVHQLPDPPPEQDEHRRRVGDRD